MVSAIAAQCDFDMVAVGQPAGTLSRHVCPVTCQDCGDPAALGVWATGGTPACTDDSAGVLASLGQTCAELVAGGGCDLAFSTAEAGENAPDISVGQLCPAACNACTYTWICEDGLGLGYPFGCEGSACAGSEFVDCPTIASYQACPMTVQQIIDHTQNTLSGGGLQPDTRMDEACKLSCDTCLEEVTCTFIVGDGTGGREEKAGETNTADGCASQAVFCILAVCSDNGGCCIRRLSARPQHRTGRNGRHLLFKWCRLLRGVLDGRLPR